GELVAELLGGQLLVEGKSLEAVIKTHRSPRVLHFGTYAFFLADQSDQEDLRLNRLTPLAAEKRIENVLIRSGLALAGANMSRKSGRLPTRLDDDGLLTVEEITGLDLTGTELVVLSACDMGIGDVPLGESLSALQRAFALAGARTLVMSLWKVPDQHTQKLIDDFLRRILACEPGAEALRAAQLSMKASFSHPSYWAAFICQGLPGLLPLQLEEAPAPFVEAVDPYVVGKPVSGSLFVGRRDILDTIANNLK